MLHASIIKYVFEIYLGIICIVAGKNGEESMEGLKTVQLSTVHPVITLLENLPVSFLSFIAE